MVLRSVWGAGCLGSYQTDPRVCLLCVFDSGFSPGLFNIKMEASQLYTCTYLLSTLIMHVMHTKGMQLRWPKYG